MKKRFLAVLSLCLVLILGMTTPAEGYRMDYEVMVSPQYEAVGTYHCGLAAVKKDGKWGYIDEEGTMAIAPQFVYAAPFSEGKALVGISAEVNENGMDMMELGLIDLQGTFRNLIVPTEEGGTGVLVADFYDYFENMDSEFVNDVFTYKWEDPKEFQYHNGYLVIPNGIESGVDSWAQNLIFDKNGAYMDNKVLVPYGDEGQVQELYLGGAYSDSVFYTQPPMGYDTPKIAYYTENKELVCSFDCWPAYAKDSNLIYSTYEFFDGYAGAWGGVFQTEPEYINTDFFALINKQGQIVFKGEYEQCFGFLHAGESGFRIVNNGRITLKQTEGLWGACDVTGNTAIPFVYEEMHAFAEGLCAVKKDGLWGFIDVNNNMIIAPQYTRVSHFNGGIALAEKDGVSMVIDRYNNVLEGTNTIPLSFYFSDVIRPVSETIVVEENGLYGFGKLTYNTALPQISEMSAWAFPEVCEAIQNNLIPMYLQNSYFENIRRDDFAQLIVKALEEVTGKEAVDILKERTGLSMQDVYAQNSFKDTNDLNILIANKLGIINGVSETSFAPANEISRQDAAALLMRAAKLIKGDIEVTGAVFNDDANIADYARQAVSYVTTLNIMNGVGENQFAPTSTYTREQAYVTILRLFKSLQ